jgi:hypothetical protein
MGQLVQQQTPKLFLPEKIFLLFSKKMMLEKKYPSSLQTATKGGF